MLYAIVAVIALIIDQAVKYWTSANIIVNTGKVTLIPGFIHLANVHNYGAAFSFLEGARWFFVVLCILFVALVIFVLAKNIISTPVARWMAVLVMAGAVGNCIDRIVCGYVVDMFEFEFFTFPVFNVADIFITCGAIAFCLCVLFEKEGKQTKKKKVAAAAATAAPAAETAATEVKAEKKPAVRHRKKTEIPTFPKREHVEMPKVDPNDPFAEWERRAAAPKPEQSVVYTQPERPAPVVEEPKRVIPVEKKAPAAPAPAQVKPEIKAAPKPEVKAAPVVDDEEMSFDLDDILAEFKDD